MAMIFAHSYTLKAIFIIISPANLYNELPLLIMTLRKTEIIEYKIYLVCVKSYCNWLLTRRERETGR